MGDRREPGNRREPRIYTIKRSELPPGSENGRPRGIVAAVRRRGLPEKKMQAFRGRVHPLKYGRPGGGLRMRVKSCADDFCGVPDDMLDEMLQRAVEVRIQENVRAGFPTAHYDRERRRAYMEYPDGRRVYE